MNKNKLWLWVHEELSDSWEVQTHVDNVFSLLCIFSCYIEELMLIQQRFGGDYDIAVRGECDGELSVTCVRKEMVEDE